MDTRAVSPVIGVILMLAVTVVMAAVLFANWGDTPESVHEPRLAANSQGDSVQVIALQNGPIAWEDVTVTGCTGVPSGTISGGDALTGCSGRVTLVYDNALLWQS